MDYRLEPDCSTRVRYRDPEIELIDRRFARHRLGSAALGRIRTGGLLDELAPTPRHG